MSRGRGRGRGRGRPFGNMEGIGFGPGEAAPPPILQPPPLFPNLERKPLELRIDDECDYLYSIKQELHLYVKESPFYLKVDSIKDSIERYSDRYKELTSSEGRGLGWSPEWEYFPEELQLKKKKSKRKTGSVLDIAKTKLTENKRKKKSLPVDKSVPQESGDDDVYPPKTKKQRRVTFDESDQEELEVKTKKLSSDNLNKKLNELEKAEASGEEQAENEVLSGDEEYYDEEIEEEGTDYNLTYFDNGEEDAEDDLEENEGPYY